MSGSAGDLRARDVGRRPFRGRGPLERAWPAWAALVAGPLAWGAAVGVSYVLVPVSCHWATTLPLHGVRLVTLAVAAGAAVLSYRLWRDARGDAVSLVLDRTAFLALLGVAVAGTSAALIALEGFANFVVSPCR